MKIVKGLLLVHNEQPRVVEFDRDNYKELYKLIECDTFEHAVRKVGDRTYDFWFDEEYLLKPEKHFKVTGKCNNFREMICGNLLITLSKDCEIETLNKSDIINLKNNINTYLDINTFNTINLLDYYI